MARTLEQRLLGKVRVESDTGCWLWTGSNVAGYGKCWYQKKLYTAHRLAMHVWRGASLEDSRYMRHTCGYRSCINPAHLVFDIDSLGKTSTGDPLEDLLLLRERILRRVRIDLATTCWIWTRSINGRGYGQMHWLGRQRLAHRLSLLAWKGILLDSPFDALHDCKNHGAATDNPRCVNPDHLRPGTQSENTKEWWGQRLHRHRLHRRGALTAEQVREARTAKPMDYHGAPNAHFAAKFGVSVRAIENARGRRTYTWVD